MTSTAVPAGNPAMRPAPAFPDRNLSAGANPSTRAGGPAAQPAPAGAAEKHRVQPGDTFTSLAENYYGTPRLAQFLIDSNPEIRDPRRLSVGTVVKIPAKPGETEVAADKGPAPKSDSAETGKATTGKPDGRRTYTVKEGDSFYSIAKARLGGGGKWKQLFALNKQVVDGDPRSLRPGQVLTLPDQASNE